MSMERHHVDLLAMGRSGVDVYPLQVGRHLEDVETFGKFLGGSPTNVAVAAARLGHSAGVVTGVGDEEMREQVRRAFARILLRPEEMSQALAWIGADDGLGDWFGQEGQEG